MDQRHIRFHHVVLTTSALVLFSFTASAQGTKNGYFLRDKSKTVVVYDRVGNSPPVAAGARDLDGTWYFRIAKNTTVTYQGASYTAITIGGTGCNGSTTGDCKDCVAPTGLLSRCDWGKSFWIPTAEIADIELIEAFQRESFVNLTLLNVPMKVRPSLGTTPAILDNDFNAGASFNVKWRLSTTKERFVNMVIMLGLQSLVMTDQNNTQLTADGGSENTSGILYGGGLYFQFDRIQIGGLVGFDTAFGYRSFDYIYQNKPWIGLGLGFDVFTDAAKLAGANKPTEKIKGQ